MNRRIVAVLSLVVALIPVAPAGAVTSQTWRQRERADFEKGEPKGVSLAADGSLRLSPRLDTLWETGPPYLWALAQDRKGNLYAAGGNDGVISRLAAGAKAAPFARVAEPEIHALIVDAAGNLYAGTAPHAKVYKFGPDGNQLWAYDTGEEYVWALAFDRQGALFAATGIEGRILKIDAAGRGQVFFDSAETHIRSLATGRDGELYAGSDGHGLVLRVSSKGEGFVLYDAPLAEVTGLAVAADGSLYAAVIGEAGARGPRAERPSPPPSPPAQGGGGAGGEGGSPAPQPSPTPQGQESQPPPPIAEQRIPINMEGKVLKISPDGYAREVWSGSQEAILSLAAPRGGRLLLGSSAQGRIYALDENDKVSEVARIGSGQVTAMLPLERDVAIAGSNFGTVALLRPGYAESGQFESRVLDARSFAAWGRAAWRAEAPKGTSVALTVRCGNTEEPDRTWSPWGAPLAGSDGSLVDCPTARFLQWRAMLKSADADHTPILREVAITYLQRNLPPEIKKIEVQAPGVSFQKVPASPAAGPQEGRGAGSGTGDIEGGGVKKPRPTSRRGFEPGARSVNWQASDPNDDDLVYDLYYRAADETAWKRIRREIDDDFATLDGAALPDGTYRFRVVASDAPSNPQGKALTAEELSAPFDVDNTPPRIEEIKTSMQGSTARVGFTAADSFSIIREAAWSVDAGDWVVAPPADGLEDSRSELHEIDVEGLAAGEHSIVIRATDGAGNTGAGRAVIRIP
jgi:sugar lactone lactonase YvrE